MMMTSTGTDACPSDFHWISVTWRRCWIQMLAPWLRQTIYINNLKHLDKLDLLHARYIKIYIYNILYMLCGPRWQSGQPTQDRCQLCAWAILTLKLVGSHEIRSQMAQSRWRMLQKVWLRVAICGAFLLLTFGHWWNLAIKKNMQLLAFCDNSLNMCTCCEMLCRGRFGSRGRMSLHRCLSGWPWDSQVRIDLMHFMPFNCPHLL